MWMVQLPKTWWFSQATLTMKFLSRWWIKRTTYAIWTRHSTSFSMAASAVREGSFSQAILLLVLQLSNWTNSWTWLQFRTLHSLWFSLNPQTLRWTAHKTSKLTFRRPSLKEPFTGHGWLSIWPSIRFTQMKARVPKTYLCNLTFSWPMTWRYTRMWMDLSGCLQFTSHSAQLASSTSLNLRCVQWKLKN